MPSSATGPELPRSGRLARSMVAALLICSLGFLGLLGVLSRQQQGQIDDLEVALARLERSRVASKLDSADRRDDLSTRLGALEHGVSTRPRFVPPSPGDPPGASEPSTGTEEVVSGDAERATALESEVTELLEQWEGVTDGGPGGEGLRFKLPSGVSVVTGTTASGSNPGVPSWSEVQATGAPDTDGLGDLPTAWASRRPDEGLEWLEIDFPRVLIPSAIVIVESHNPGALIRVEGGSGGSLQTLWSGTDLATEDANEFVISVSAGVSIETVRLTLDTRLVSGWNEIDAVGLEVGDTVVWGTEARASSSYAQR